MIFRVIWVIFLPMLIEMIIIGVDITHREHFINEWIELRSRIYGENTSHSIELSMFSFSRATEILFSLAQIKTPDEQMRNFFPRNDFFAMLTNARRNLALFQHHDGITGTSLNDVVDDYGRK